MCTICVLSTKGGVGKSVNSLQVASTFFLSKNEPVELLEFDDENQDSANYSQSLIPTKQIKVGDGSLLDNIMFDHFGDKTKNQVADIGGNKTTSMFIQAMQNTRIYLNFDLFIIPVASGSSQEILNARRTTDLILPFGKPILYALSRSRCDVADKDGISFQYADFFTEFPNAPYYVLKDSHSIDLSRKLSKTVWELAFDDKPLQALQDKLVAALDSGNPQLQKSIHGFIKIYNQSKDFVETSLKPAFAMIEQLTQPQKPKEQKGAKNA